MPGALVLSLVAHALVAGYVLKAWQDSRPAATVGRQKGALQVTLRRDASAPAKAATAAPERSTTTPAPRKQRARVERPAKPSPPPAVPATVAVAAPPIETPGARFASLFAPIVHAPIGNGRWTSRRASNTSATTPTATPEQQREEALMALRASLAARFASMAEQLRAAQAQIACDLVVDIERRIG